MLVKQSVWWVRVVTYMAEDSGSLGSLNQQMRMSIEQESFDVLFHVAGSTFLGSNTRACAPPRLSYTSYVF